MVGVAPEEVGGGRTTVDGARYRPHLDGLRCLAVYLVVVFHAGWAPASNGFIGVDVFFVLSGYLVTEVLLRDLHRRGAVDLRRFYSRRVRRLLPAALVAIIGSSLVYRVVASPAELDSALGTVQAALLYVANWAFIGRETDYFASEASASPVFQFWSLSVEEQFYVVWPLLLAGLHSLAGRFGSLRAVVLRVVVAAAGGASLVAALALAADGQVARAYYGTDTRAYQLLAGALLALTPGILRWAAAHRPLRVLAPVGLVGIVVLSTQLIPLDPVPRGAVAVLVVLLVLVGVEAHPGGVVARAFSVAPVTYLGRISYGTYLWHWIVILVARDALELTTAQLAVGAAVLATGLAALSYEILEQPVRRAGPLDRLGVPTVAVGLALSLVGAVVVAPTVLRPDQSSAVVVQGTAVGAQEVPADLDVRGAARDNPDLPDCEGGPPQGCTVVEGGSPHVMLIGDSHARMLLPLFEAIARSRDLTLSVGVRPACPWQEDVFFLVHAEECREGREDAYRRLLPQLQPDVVIAAGLALDDPSRSAPLDAPGVPDLGAHLEERTRTSVERLSELAPEVVLVEPVPLAPEGQEDPLDCLGRARFLEECRFVVPGRPLDLERTYRELAQRDGVSTLDLDRLVCPYLPICDPLVDRLIVRRNGLHITGTFAASLAPAVEEALDDQGLL